MVILLTFDVDMANYTSSDWDHFDELDEAFEGIRQILNKNPEVKTTWFVRIDGQIEALYGRADHIFSKHNDKIEWLREQGHEVGWHLHPYREINDKWVQETAIDKVCEEIHRYAQLARSYALNAVRMGWGYHTNETMSLLNEQGFTIDSSAMPRPKYTWDMSVKDWSVTPARSYRPSVGDYRVPGHPSLQITEIPMSTVVIEAPMDTEANVVRYINAAYHPEIFSKAVDNVKGDYLLTITHPYELITNGNRHSLLSFDLNSLAQNINYLKSKSSDFRTITGLLR